MATLDIYDKGFYKANFHYLDFGQIGLRGAMAFALALQSVHELPEGHGKTILTATTAIVVLTVFSHFSHSLILGTSQEMMKLPIGMAFLYVYCISSDGMMCCL